MKRVAFLTLGCRVNQAESSDIEASLKAGGCSVVSLKERPDYCIVNTCAVTGKSDYQSRQLIRRAARSGARIIVTGCYAQLNRDSVSAMDGVEAVVDIKKKDSIVRLFADIDDGSFSGRYDRSRPYLKVQDGCNFRCTYCAVPLARGVSRSLARETVIRRAQMIESRGYNEIVLTGIHLGSYGHDLADRSSLVSLISDLLEKTSLPRIRLSSLEIGEMSEALIDLATDRRICPHFHLPLQSGSGRVLERMARRYTPREFSSKVGILSRRIENVCLGTDVIIGFPGEGEDDFSDTLGLMRDLPIAYAHIFPYSSRPGTAAAAMRHLPERNALQSRLDRITDLAQSKKAAYMSRQIGRTLDVVLEERLDQGGFAGTSGNYMKVVLPSGDEKRGNLVFARVVAASDGILRGSVISSVQLAEM